MYEIKKICEAETDLTEESILILEKVAENIQLYADLYTSDMFIDCMSKNGVAIVVAEASPQYAVSLYENSVLRYYALKEDEPAVYEAFASGFPVLDMRAKTQFERSVSQNVAPIKNNDNEVIGVLISEQDISRYVNIEEKLHELSKPEFGTDERNDISETTLIREAHHRIKNNLQMISNICSVKARSSPSIDVQTALRETSSMILTMAALHDILSITEDETSVSLLDLLKKANNNMAELYLSDVKVTFSGGDILVPRTQANSVAMVVNELVTNSVLHAFPDGHGSVFVTLDKGLRYSSVVVEDDGCGFDNKSRIGTGLKIAAMIVQDKLGGSFGIDTAGKGTKARITFKNEI